MSEYKLEEQMFIWAVADCVSVKKILIRECIYLHENRQAPEGSINHTAMMSTILLKLN